MSICVVASGAGEYRVWVVVTAARVIVAIYSSRLASLLVWLFVTGLDVGAKA